MRYGFAVEYAGGEGELETGVPERGTGPGMALVAGHPGMRSVSLRDRCPAGKAEELECGRHTRRPQTQRVGRKGGRR
jgi:hypothetical protein